MLAAGTRIYSGGDRSAGRFLLGRTLTLGPFFIVVFFAVLWIAWLLLLAGVWSPKSDFPKIDFFAFWSASSLTLQGEPAASYDVEAMGQEQLQLPGDESGFHPWRNPPPFLFLVLPLALLPVSASLLAWSAATGGLLLSAVRRMSADRRVLILALAFPATTWNLIIGQNGFLTAGLLAWGVLLLRDRPVVAGALLGMIAYKPQFLPLIFVALLASREWRALASAGVCIGLMSFASLVLFGIDSWEGFIEWGFRSSDSIYTSSAQIEKMQSVSAVLLLTGLDPFAAKLGQLAAVIASTVFVVWLWRQDATGPEYRGAGLALAVLLASPYSYHYDLTLLGLAVLWLGVRFQVDGWRSGDKIVLTLGWLAPLLTVFTASFLGFPVGPLVILMLLAILVRRVRQPWGVTENRSHGNLAVTPV